jgi:cytosine deaminase
VRDAFYAYGDLDAFEVLLAGIRIGHMDNDLVHAPELVTTTPGQIMGLDGYGWLGCGAPARLIAFAGRSFSEWLSRPTQGRKLFEYDRWLEPAVPPYPILSRQGEGGGAHPS